MRDDSTLQTYLRNGVLIDSNILLLFLVGSCEPSLIGHFDRISSFNYDDFELLVNVMNRFRTVVYTPSIITEVNNLATKLYGPTKMAFLMTLRRFVEKMVEEFHPSREVVVTEFFAKFGYADAAIAVAAKQRYLVLTNDSRLSGFLRAQEIDAINFSELRYL